MAITVNSSEFEFSHGKKPRGFGSWAFQLEGRADLFWVHQSTFGAAKKAAVEEARKHGVSYLTVCT